MQDGEYGKGAKETAVSMMVTQPVTYSWENIEVYLEIKQGNIFKRLPAVRKRILDNGYIALLNESMRNLRLLYNL